MRAVSVLSAAAVIMATSVPAAPGRTQTFTCAAVTAGQLSVQANVQCACGWFAASGLRGTPAGYRWDCGILRARANHEVPATDNFYPYPLPEALSIERPLILPDGGTPRHP
jgi:hypothetical protein